MERIGGQSSEFSHVPSTLQGHLFLLAFDPKQGRFDGHDPTLGLAEAIRLRRDDVAVRWMGGTP